MIRTLEIVAKVGRSVHSSASLAIDRAGHVTDHSLLRLSYQPILAHIVAVLMLSLVLISVVRLLLRGNPLLLISRARLAAVDVTIRYRQLLLR